MTVPDLRSQAYCDLVATCEIYVEGNSLKSLPPLTLFFRHLLIFGADANHDVYIFAGTIGLGAPAHLDFDESPVIIAHCPITHYCTCTRQLYHPWCAP